MIGSEGLQISRDGATLVATIDRGEENKLTGAMTRGLAGELETASREGELRFLVLRAEGERFCLGREQEGRTPDEVREVASGIVRLNQAIRESPLISICAAHGDAAGLGVGLIASCDVAVAAEGARFWFPELEAGLAPAVVIAWLARTVPRKRAFDLVATGRRMDAAEALECGLVTELATAAEVEATARRWTERLAALHPESLRDAKRFLSLAAAIDERSAGRAAVDALTLGTLRLRAPAE